MGMGMGIGMGMGRVGICTEEYVRIGMWVCMCVYSEVTYDFLASCR